MKRTIFSIAILLLTFIGAFSQIKTPIKWNNKVEMTSAQEGEFVFVVTVDQGWHLYGFNLPEGGPKSTNIIFDKNDNVELIGSIVPSIPPVEKVDPIFSLQLSWWDSNVTFKQKFRIKEDVKTTITGRIEFQGCNNESCIAPTKEVFSLEVGSRPANPSAVVDSVVVQQPQMIQSQQNQLNQKNNAESSWWAPVNVPAEDASEQPSTNSPWWMIFIYGFFGGLAALITPCVWPLIPMTVSFFLKKNKSRTKSIQDAMTYGIAIIVIYLILGLAITVIFGAGKLNELATSALFNIIFFVLLVVFGISFLGAFDIKLPSKWSNAIDGKAEQTTGFISIFFMAFTLALVSFSCTGPLIGTLLVEAASIGDISGPAIGMAGFAIALAIPFTLFAIFPSMLKSMPKSGGWLNSVKVVLGFLELAFALKFLSVADLAYGWRILDRETFLALWIVLFALLGFYLLGKIKFPHDDDDTKVSVPRFFMALISLAFAVYMVPGLWGAPLKAVSAFAPPMWTQDFNLYTKEVHAQFDDYEMGMEYARKNGKPVMLDFTGYGCVNCRKMEQAVWTDTKVSDMIQNDYVLITLYVDKKDKLPEPIKVMENGRERVLRTVGDKWSYLQRVKFGANAQPFYVLLDNEGNPLNTSYSFDEDVAKYVDFLSTGLENYKK